MSSRIFILFTALFALWSLALARGAYLQLFPNERLDQLRKRQFEKIILLRARRGVVYDRFQRELAVSVPSQSVFVDPGLVKDLRSTSRLLGKALGVRSERLAKVIRASKGRRFVWIQRQIPDAVHRKVAALKLPGVGFIEEPKRIYPNNALMGQVLGFVGSEGQGLEGLEYLYNEPLLGRDARVQVRRDARGRPLLMDGRLITINPDGADLHLTLDAELQFFVENELAQTRAEFEAERATGLILDVSTGEILAAASLPHYDPNFPQRAADGARRNHVATDTLEPGSVMKTFVMAAGLKHNELKPNTRVDCGDGVMKIADRVVREAESTHRFGVLTATEVLAMSSNVGTAKIALDLGAEKLRQTLADFGFGEKSGIDLPGESPGVLRSLPWNQHLLSNVSFGHGLTATPLQIAAAYAAIASGGWLRRPFIVRRVYNADSKEEVITEPRTVRRALTAEQAQTLSLMLMAATGPGGTGFSARVPGYPVAGKTGTAQKADLQNGGYLKGSYVSSFVGFLPANDPKYVIYVSVDGPKKAYYASKVAAPLFSRVAGFAMRKAGLPPVLLEEKNLVQDNRRRRETEDHQRRAIDGLQRSLNAQDTSRTPALSGLSLREAMSRLRDHGVRVLPSGVGHVVDSVPGPGEGLPPSRVVRLYLEPKTSESAGP